MLEAYQTLTDVPTFTWVVIVLLSGSISWFLKAVVGSAGLAILFAPLLALGALLSTFLINANSISLSADKDTHAVSAASVGILVTLMLLLGAYFVWGQISDARVKARKVSHALTDPTGR